MFGKYNENEYYNEYCEIMRLHEENQRLHEQLQKLQDDKNAIFTKIIYELHTNTSK